MIRFLRTQALICTIFCLLSMAVVFARKSSKTPQASSGSVLTGQSAFTDAAHESPGIRRHVTVGDLPAPAPDQSVDNGPSMIPRPANAWPIAPKGLQGRALRHRSRQSPPPARRAQRRPLPGRKRNRQDQGLSRRQPRTASRSRPPSSQTACISRSASRSIPRAPIPNTSTSATPTASSASLTRMAI